MVVVHKTVRFFTYLFFFLLIKVPSDENTELKGSPFKTWSRSVYSIRWFWPDLMNGRHDHTTAV